VSSPVSSRGRCGSTLLSLRLLNTCCRVPPAIAAKERRKEESIFFPPSLSTIAFSHHATRLPAQRLAVRSSPRWSADGVDDVDLQRVLVDADTPSETNGPLSSFFPPSLAHLPTPTTSSPETLVPELHDDAGGSRSRMLEQCILEVAGVHVKQRGMIHFLLRSTMNRYPLVVDVAEVAGVQPSVPELSAVVSWERQ